MGNITIVGGGASGLMAAATAAAAGAEVTLIEQNSRVGKKLLSTGNGRCNYTNLRQEPSCYHSENPSFPWGIVSQFGASETVAFFRELGIQPKSREGYLYPNSDQASSVLDVLRMECARLQVKVRTDCRCTDIRPGKTGFRLKTSSGMVPAGQVILASGSFASVTAESGDSGYTLAKRLGHRIVPVVPALVQLKCREDFYKSISGVRVMGEVAVYADGACIGRDRGEIQLTGYGISGIPVFQVSGAAAAALHEGKSVKAVLDFMPELEWEAFLAFLKERINTRPEKTLEEFFVGLFPKKLWDLWIRLSRIPRSQRAGDLNDGQIEKLAGLIRRFETQVTGTNPFSQAQVCRGGIDTREVDPKTLESRLVPGLYFAGEILDVDGLCGGYNLQWAWSSGHVSGKEAAHAEA